MPNKLILYVFLCFFIVGCSIKRNSFKNRIYHQINTDFNTLFNGEETLKEEVKKINDQYVEDYTTVLRLEKTPLIKKNDSLLVKEDTIEKDNFFKGVTGMPSFLKKEEENTKSKTQGFDRSVEKASKSIANHSMNIGGEEYNRSIRKSYKLIGQARYYRGQSLPAIEAFDYAKQITKKKKHKEEINRWLAKAYEQLGNDKLAESIYKELLENYLNQKTLKKSLYDYAQFKLDDEKYEEALKLIEKVIRTEKDRKVKARLLFISAQLKNNLNLEEESLATYTEVRKYKPSYQMELKTYTNYIFQKKIIPSLEEKSLEKILNGYLTKSLYFEYKDEVYYALGLIYDKKNDADKANEYFAKSLKETASDPDNRMVIYRNLGEKFFQQDHYSQAKKYYDSAYAVARKEKKALLKYKLDKLSSIDEMYAKVKEKDSILTLVKMPLDKQKKYFEAYIEKLKEEEIKLKKKEESKQKKLLLEKKIDAFSQSFGTNEDAKNWYFYNNKLKAFGQEEFKKTWGNRFLTDHWRRKSYSDFLANPIANKTKDSLTSKGQDDVENKYNVNDYLTKIPTSEKEIIELNKERDSVQLKLGIAYYNYFKNVKKSDFSLNDLIIKVPLNDNITQKAYFNLYKMYRDENNIAEMNKYGNIILANYPNSVYAAFVKNPTGFLSNQSNTEATLLYSNALNLYQKQEYNQALGLIESQYTIYKGQANEPKFAILKAFIIGKEKGKEAFISELKKVAFLYENSEEAIKANEIITSLLSQKKQEENLEKKLKPEPKVESGEIQ